MATHDQIATRWVRQTADAARGFAMFFDGKTLFSYGRHFAIARLVSTPRGTVCLFNSEGYSVSTAKHKCITRRALHRFEPFMPVYDVPHVNAATEVEHEANYLDMCQRAANQRAKARRARVYKDQCRAAAERLDAMAWDYAACFGIEETPALAA
jgi:hypothetical protein